MTAFDPRRVGRDLARKRRTYGGRDWPESFADRLTEPLPGLAEVWRMRREPRPSTVDAAGIPVAVRDALPAAADSVDVTWIGHATFVVRIGGLTVLTDPVWSRRIIGVPERLTPPGLPWPALPPVDAVVISHNHYDHLDAPTIRRLPRTTPVFVPGMLGSWFRQRGFRAVAELDWWESATVGGATLTFVPAHHWSRRGLTDTCRTLWGGWLLSDGSATVYFAGDTGYGHWFREVGSRFPAIDLALMPVGAFEPRWFMRPMHCDPAEAVQACVDVGARRMVPMHWGTFVLSSEPLLAPLDGAVAAWADTGRDPADLWTLAIGETRGW